MKIKAFIFGCIIAACSSAFAFAGDVASFVNLGFSDDSGYFMFGVHGIDGQTKKPFSELYVVDVQANSFVPGGSLRETFGEELQPGQDSGGALYSLVEKNGTLSQKYRIRHLRQGRPLYIPMSGDTGKSSLLEFRDFNTQNTYSVRLDQKTSGAGAQGKTAFGINFTLTSSGAAKNFSIGKPDYFRDGVLDYRICQILLSPDEKRLVFVIEKDQYTSAGKAVRYMVETVNIF